MRVMPQALGKVVKTKCQSRPPALCLRRSQDLNNERAKPIESPGRRTAGIREPVGNQCNLSLTMKTSMNRRQFLGTTSIAGASLAFSWPHLARGAEAAAKPVALGGAKAHPGGFPGWPVIDQTEEKALLDALHSGHWFRGSGANVSKFEDEYEKLTGAKHALATASGTAALTTVMGALDIGPGDEVITTPYTFVATYNAIVLNYALPIFVDTDVESFQIDANKIEAAITPQTKALLPVHIGGSPANLDKILEVGLKHKLPVIEDACQAHLAEWRGR